jgi:hypothetical protein
MKFFKALLAAVPFLFISNTAANMLYLSVVTLFPQLGSSASSIALHSALFVITGIFFFKWREILTSKSLNLRASIFLLGLFFSVYLLRSPLYFPTHDDLAFHIPAAFYGQSPFDITVFGGIQEYKYPALNLNYAPFLASIGLRASLLLSGLVISLWFISLFNRFSEFVPKKSQFLLLLTFVCIYFFPQLVSIHATFMTDVFSLLICLETFYCFFKLQHAKNPDTQTANVIPLGLLLTFMSVVLKQSTIVLLPTWIFISGYFLWNLKKNLLTKNQLIKALLPVIIFSFFSSVYFLRTNIDTNLYIRHFESTGESLFGPLNVGQTFLWPIIGPFTSRYSELYISWYTKIFFTFIVGLTCVYHFINFLIGSTSRKKFFTTQTFFSGVILLTYLFWTLFSGYGRYIVPLHFFALMWVITRFASPVREKVQAIFSKKFMKPVFLIFFTLLSFSSIKSDYAWRPYPSLRNSSSSSYFVQEYMNGVNNLFKDTIYQIADRYTPIFSNIDATVTTRYGMNNFVNFLGGLEGKPTLSNVFFADGEKYKIGQQKSHRIENTFRVLENTQRILVVSDPGTQDVIPLLYATHDFECTPTPNLTLIPEIQAHILEDLKLFLCVRKSTLAHNLTEPEKTPLPSPSPKSTKKAAAPNLPQIIADIEKGERIPCEGEVITDQFVEKDNVNLIKENIKQGRLTDVCIKPKYFIVHWVGKWINAQSVKDTLEGNGLSCQLTTERNKVWALMNFYPDRVERAACSGRNSNLITLNNELNGVCFDQALAGKLVPDNIPDEAYPDFHDDVEAICNYFAKNTQDGTDTKYKNVFVHDRHQELMEMTDAAVENACKIRQQYHIPVQNFIGHFDIPVTYTIYPKSDPGREYAKFFRQKLLERCPIPEDKTQ